MDLTTKQKRHLRSLAHSLKPIFQIGGKGITEGVVTKTDEALESHELIKIKNLDLSPLNTKDAGTQLAKATQSAVAQVIGRTIVLYRRRSKKPTIRLPDPKPSATE